jgi:hypothetical protein
MTLPVPLPLLAAKPMPSPVLPEMRLPAPVLVPPMVLSEPLVTIAPSPPLASAGHIAVEVETSWMYAAPCCWVLPIFCP